ncbi:hypothetical protein EVS84_22865 [Pseudomonas koreensis]|uniref:Uncharacterized protein n=1 Tax=Pseudomonas koreensis TaxID=198620 RepID=A0A4Q4KX48_9PSED|nr:hypothetical protein EVS84_22865 [Pseudomonas koreensis]
MGAKALKYLSRSAPLRFTCGSEPAREGADTFNIDVSDRPPSRAGSLPQEKCGVIELKNHAVSAVARRRCAHRRTGRSGWDCRSGS